MDHACEKCGSLVPDRRPFCAQCGAPQVRVAIEAAPETIPASPSDPPITIDSSHTTTSIPSAGSLPFRVALQAGLLGVMANLIPFGLGMVLTGILAALLYHRASRGILASGKAARLGAMAGAIAFAATSFLTVLAVVLLGAQQQFQDVMMKALEQGISNQSDPEVQRFLQWSHTPQGFGIILAFGMIGALLLSMLLSAAGSLVGAKLFRARSRPPS